MLPDPGKIAPSGEAFAEAQDRKRLLLGSNITFFWPPVVTFPVGLAINPESGQPYDPVTASGLASSQASASAVCGVFFKAVNRGGAANADVATAIGRDEKTRVFLNVASGDVMRLGLQASGGVSEFEFHGNRFQVYARKWDEVGVGYKRWLVYAAEKGTSQ